jgi:biopolymer transport protein TolQ
MSMLGYFFQAGLIVKLVMLFLLSASVVSWTLIIQRSWFFRNKQAEYKKFSKRFWRSEDLGTLYSEMHNRNKSGIAAIFFAGFKEFVRLNKQNSHNLESMQRVMQIEYQKEEEMLEQHLALLASIGSLAPYVGLFGTVWGIMTSFQALGHASQATIAMVAPGISEALIATALGLFTAIPAVIAYNKYTSSANTILNRYDLFQEEFIALIQEQI